MQGRGLKSCIDNISQSKETLGNDHKSLKYVQHGPQSGKREYDERGQESHSSDREPREYTAMTHYDKRGQESQISDHEPRKYTSMSPYRDQNHGQGLVRQNTGVTGYQGLQNIQVLNSDNHIGQKISVWKGSITQLRVKAIVNAANNSLLGGGGVDGVIHRAAGPSLKEECALLQGCKTGDAKLTNGHRLPAQYIIHTVGPRVRNNIPTSQDRELLRQSYQRCLDIVQKYNMSTVAFPCISTGVYGFPKKLAAEIAVQTVRDWLCEGQNVDRIQRIIFCVFSEEDEQLYQTLCHRYLTHSQNQKSDDSGKWTQWRESTVNISSGSSEYEMPTSGVDSFENSETHVNTSHDGAPARELANISHHASAPEDHVYVAASELQVYEQEVADHDEMDLTMSIPVNIRGTKVLSVVDTAAQGTLISDTLMNKLKLSYSCHDPIMVRGIGQKVVKGHLLKGLKIQIGSKTFVKDVIVIPMKDDMILGLDFLRQISAVIDIKANVVIVGDEIIPAVLKQSLSGETITVSKVQVCKKTTIPPNTGKIIKCHLSNAIQGDMVIEPCHTVGRKVWIPEILVKGANVVPIMAMNLTDKAITVPAKELIGCATEVEHVVERDENTELELERELTSVEQDQNHDDITLIDGEDGNQQMEHDSTLEIPKHLKEMFERSVEFLTADEQQVFKALLIEYQDVFSMHEYDLGEFTAIQHRIITPDAVPVRMRLRRTPLGLQDEEEKIINALLKAKVIRPSDSEWSACPMLVSKKSGGKRLVVDYRKLNDCTRKDAFPIPLIEECLDALAGNMWFSTLDMSSGYWQIPLNPEDSHKTAFITKYGLFEYVRMAQGLCGAPATYQRAMNLVLRGLLWKSNLAYMDDVICLGKTFKNHIKNVRDTFDRFRSYKLKLKPSKCLFFQKELDFLGRKAGRDGVSITQAKVQAVLDWTIPQNKTEVESFLGFVNYHRAHIPDLAEKARPLYELTLGEGQDICWEDVHQKAFEDLQMAVVTAPVLAYPTTDDIFILDTDSSDHSIGAELLQVQNGMERTIAYASQSLTPAQKRYCTTRKELLAVITYLNHFRFYLLGKQFFLRTDHNSLTWLTRFKYTDGQLARWLEVISQFDVKILHRPGKLHQNADSLSRIPSLEPCDCYEAGKDVNSLPCGGCNHCSRLHSKWARYESHVDVIAPVAVRQVEVKEMESDSDIGDIWSDVMSTKQMGEEQMSDSDISPIIIWLKESIQPTQNELFRHSTATKSYWNCKKQLVMKDGLLYYKWICDEHPGVRLKLVVPRSMRDKVFHLCHDVKSSSHPGQKETMNRVKRSFYWYGMGTDSKTYVETCAVCNKNKKPRVKPKAGMKNYHAGSPMERVHIDILGPLPETDRKNRYIFVMIDQFTKWTELVALPSQSAENVADALVKDFICRMGIALNIHSDQGRNFEGHLFQEICKLLEMAKTRTTPYRPSANGQVERKNRDILDKIRCNLERQRDWDLDLPIIGMSIRAAENRSTGFTPNMMMLGREVMLPSEVVTGVGMVNLEEKEPAEHVKELRDRLHRVHSLARKNLGLSLEYQKRKHDGKLFEKSFEKGDLVYLLGGVKTPGQSRKLLPVYSGPFVVTEVYSPILYRICGQKNHKSQVVHHDRLRICRDRVIPLWAQRKRLRMLETGNSTVNQDELDLTLLNDNSNMDSGTEDQHDTGHDDRGNSEQNETGTQNVGLIPEQDETDVVCSDPHDTSYGLGQDISPTVTRYGRTSRPPKRYQDGYQ